MSKYGGKKTTQELLWIRATTKIRRNCDGTCCQCGACCDRVLMLTKREQIAIQQYLKKHPNIRKRVDEIYKGKPHRQCPFLDVTKEGEKCLIYGTDAYPIICKEYNCDTSKISQENLAKKLVSSIMFGDIPQYVDLWYEFCEDPTNISEAWEKMDKYVNENKVHLNPINWQTPEKFPEWFK